MKNSCRHRLWLEVVLTVVLSGCLVASRPFTDDFSDPASGWGAASYETYVRGYQQGKYLFQIDVPRWFVWAASGHVFSDVELKAVARSAGERDNHYGLLCRYTDGAFYYFAISADGYYAIFRKESGGKLYPLTGQAMMRSPIIRTDGGDNHLAATCLGTVLTFYVNGEQVARVEDDALSKGDVGMAAGTVSRGGTSVWFDDFEALKP